MKINLVKGGIFPIIKDGEGNLLPKQEDSTGYNVAATFQGEGKLLGTPCLFIRTSGCNLRCSWIGSDGNGSPCDTPYSSHKPESNMMEIGDIIKIVNANCKPQNIPYIVISGGEPTLQSEPLGELVKHLNLIGYHTTIETNATIFDEQVAEYTNLLSMSPKLKSSTPWEQNMFNTGLKYNEKWAERHERERRNIEVIQKYIDSCYDVFHSRPSALTGEDRIIKTRSKSKDFQLKFVVSKPEDILEIETDFLFQLEGVNPDDVCLMPEGVTVEDLTSKTKWVAEEALKRGWRFTPRLHVLMFGKNRYV